VEFNESLPCQCNRACEQYGDCCRDYAGSCASNRSGAVAGSKGPREKRERAPPKTMQDPKLAIGGGPTLTTQQLRAELWRAQGPANMTFYLYRAQSDAEYPAENINAADLPGVMWYLHNEVVVSTPRKYGVTRILRFKVTVMNTQELFDATRTQFGSYVAFDSAKCTVPKCGSLWRKFGYVVGCQHLGTDLLNYASLDTAEGGYWYSLPGPCPSKSLSERKSQRCKEQEPGGSCGSVNGSRHCTYHVEHAGEVRLDELVGISDYQQFLSSGNWEYDAGKDRGSGISFWDGRHDPSKCRRRLERLRELFGKRYPDLPEAMAEPGCR